MNTFFNLFFQGKHFEKDFFDPAAANFKHETPFLEKGDTLVCFGDSLTAATPGYMGLLTERLSAQGITVINAGRGGDKTPLSLTRLEQDVVAAKPTAVSIFLGTNDAAIGRNLWSHEPMVAPQTYKDNLIWMVYLCQLHGGIQKFSICTPSGRLEGNAYLQHGDLNITYCRMAREAADHAGTWLVPWDAVFNEYWRRNGDKAKENGLLLSNDGIHLTGKGYELLAETMIRAWRIDA